MMRSVHRLKVGISLETPSHVEVLGHLLDTTLWAELQLEGVVYVSCVPDSACGLGDAFRALLCCSGRSLHTLVSL